MREAIAELTVRWIRSGRWDQPCENPNYVAVSIRRKVIDVRARQRGRADLNIDDLFEHEIESESESAQDAERVLVAREQDAERARLAREKLTVIETTMPKHHLEVLYRNAELDAELVAELTAELTAEGGNRSSLGLGECADGIHLAAILDISHDAARARLSRARAYLKLNHSA